MRESQHTALLAALAIAAAFTGSFVGAGLVNKITIESLHIVIAAALTLVGAALVAGIVAGIV